jgi:UDP-N-acetylglucosamine transferase subunit ALG13
MILITVGTEKFPFNRLMQWIERLIEENFIDLDKEEVVIQYGSCNIIPQGTNSYSLLSEVEFKKLLDRARLIIAHCGEGTLDLLATTNKPFILVPRSYEFGEHVDDHQIELAEILSKQGINIANCPGDLVRFITSPQTVKFSTIPTIYYARTSQLLQAEYTKVTKKADFGLAHLVNNFGFLRNVFA